MAFDGGGDQNTPLTSINITPLVDVVLVLLVVLMVAASSAVSEALPLNLPSARSGAATEAPLRVAISAAGQLSLDGSPLAARPPEGGRLASGALEEMSRYVARQRARDENLRAAIAADGAVPHRQVVQVMDALQKVGVTRLAVQVVPEAP